MNRSPLKRLRTFVFDVAVLSCAGYLVFASTSSSVKFVIAERAKSHLQDIERTLGRIERSTAIQEAKAESSKPEHLPVVLTAYTCDVHTRAEKNLNCPNGITADGHIPLEGRTIACSADMRGHTVFIDGIGERTCEDTGGAIGEGHFDLYMSSMHAARHFGVQHGTYFVIE